MSDQANANSCGGSGPAYTPCPSSPQLQLYQTIIFAAPVLFAFFLLLLFCVFYQRRRQDTQLRAQFLRGGLLAPSAIDNGLSRSLREKLPIVLFDEEFSSTCQDTQCAVCLGDYQANEKLQQLPFCRHTFHVECIDEWLAKNTTCPICRLSLEPKTRCLGDGSVEANSREFLLDNRLWEVRVASGYFNVLGPPSFRPYAMPQSTHVQTVGGASSSTAGAATSEGEHVLTVERS